MFNSGLKKECLNELKYAKERLDEKINEVEKFSVDLFKSREENVLLIKKVNEFVNQIANSPKEFDTNVKQIEVNLNSFNKAFDILDQDKSNTNIHGGIAGAGVVAGVGVAAFGPTAAMAIATTFGTASTGTAIATLSGAAATNAALAWLGGGALVAGGTGMAGGSALLALAGPVGWAIGGTALIGSGLLANAKNKKIAQEAYDMTVKVEKETKKIEGIIYEVNKLKGLTTDMIFEISKLMLELSNMATYDYSKLDENTKYKLGILVNATLSSSKLLNKTIGE